MHYIKLGTGCVTACILAISACAPDEGILENSEGEMVESTTQEFAEASCLTTSADRTLYSWLTQNDCTGSGTKSISVVVSPNGSYNHSNCANAYFVDFQTSLLPTTIRGNWGGEPAPADLYCTMRRIKTRVFAYAGAYTQEVTGS